MAEGSLCEIKTALLKVYQHATLAYSDVVLALTPMITRQAEYDDQCRRVEQVELQVIAARRDLEKHIADHGC